MPLRETRPYVGLMPVMPVSAAGWRIEPPVSVPVAPGAMRAATAAAEPPEEPPGTRGRLSPRRFHGLSTGPKALVMFDEPMANSARLALPSITAPSRHRLAVTVDSYGGTKPFRILLPAVVCTPLVQKRYLIASGMPSSGLRSPLLRLASTALAWSMASSGVSTMKALRD